MNARSSATALFAFCFSLVSSSGTTSVTVTHSTTLKRIGDDHLTCRITKRSIHPLVVDWPQTSQESLDGAAQQGLIVVSYDGCKLNVLSSCHAGEGYDFRQLKPVWQRLAIASESELYAHLPLSAASLKGELGTAERIELDYVIVGEREATSPPSMLQGDCHGATHYVRSMQVGAYGLNAVGSTGKKGSGGRQFKEVQRLRGSGDVETCATAASAEASCGAVVQLGLAPLMVDGGKLVISASVDAGLGSVPDVPKIGPMPPLPRLEGDLSEMDAKLLRLLRDARRADDANVPPLDKAAAWENIAVYEPKNGKNIYRDLASARQKAWEEVHDAAEVRRGHVVKVCAQYKRENAKLEQLLSLDDDLVTPRQKAAYRAELKVRFAPFAKELAKCAKIATCPAGMAWIPERTFQVVSETKGNPSRSITLAGFCMDTTEVTVAAYAECVRSGTCSPAHEEVNRRAISEDDRAFWSRFCNGNRSDRQNHPVNCVDWEQARTYCAAQGKRLPTDEEWEHAARSGNEQRTYAWGEEAPGLRLLNACGGECVALGTRRRKRWQGMYLGNDGWEGTAPVRSYLRGRTAHDLFDMAGNVSEWTSTGWSADYSDDRTTSRQVVRGSGWHDGDPSAAKADFYSIEDPTIVSSTVGFRCAMTP